MNPGDDRTDRAIADALRATSGDPYQGSLDDLARRIDVAAIPILTARSQRGPRPAMWWEFAADWARTLIPVGLTIAAASVTLLWLMRPVAPVASVVVSRDAAAPDLVDRAVEELVTPTGTPSTRRQPR